MFRRSMIAALIFALILAALAAQSADAAPVVANASFETFSGGAQGFTPTFGPIVIGSWTAGTSGSGQYEGVSINLAGMTAAPNGSVAAFIEGPGTLSQSISGFSAANVYSISFYAEKYSGAGEPLQFLIDSTVLTFNAGAATTQLPGSSSSFTQYTTDQFMVSAGTHTLTINGTVPDAPAISFIDVVAV